MAQLPFAVVPHTLLDITAGSAQPGRPGSHVGELAYPGMIWQSVPEQGGEYLRGRFIGPRGVDFIALLGTNAKPGTVIRYMLSTTPIGVTANTYDVSETLISPARTEASGVYHSHHQLAPVVASYWGIDISNHTGGFQAAGLVIGQRSSPATYYDPTWERGVEDLGSLELTRWGVPEITPGRIARKLSLRFGWLSEQDQEQKFATLAALLGKRGLSYWCFDPEPTVYRQAKTYMGWFRSPPYARAGAMPGRHESGFELLSLI